jgi:hypothetical protein
VGGADNDRSSADDGMEEDLGHGTTFSLLGTA